MRRIYFTLLLTLSIFSCKDKTSCSNAELSDNITVLGFGDLTKKITSFHRFNPKVKKFERIEIKNIKYRENKNLSGYGESIIILEEPLFSEENYRLIIDDIKYNITDIKIVSEVRMMGMREDSICRINSFKINKKIAKQIYNTSTITFNKPN